MAIGYRNFEIRAQKAAEAHARKSQNINGYTACTRQGERTDHASIDSAKSAVSCGGRVIRNRDCVVVFKV